MVVCDSVALVWCLTSEWLYSPQTDIGQYV